MAVVADIDDQFVGDGYLNGETVGAGMPNSVADGFGDDSLGVLSQLGTNSGHWTGHVQRRSDVSVLGQIGDHTLDLPTEPAVVLSRRLQLEDGGADIFDRGLQIINCLIKPVDDFSRVRACNGALYVHADRE